MEGEMSNKKVLVFAAAVSLCMAALVSCNKTAGTDSMSDAGSDPVKHGEYLVKITGCNDCHTPGYPEADGNIPVNDWLTGSPLGWRGPWGTTYAINLRLFMQGLSEDQWIAYARSARSRPPMPWYILRDLTDSDLVAMYKFVRYLGPAGDPMPAYVPPGKEPTGPYVEFPSN
jgi:mono/diheme cytochrome c family protein